MARSRELILASLRRLGGAERPLPELAPAPPPLTDPVGRFRETLAAAGGSCELLAGAELLGPALRALPVIAAARRIYSGVAALASQHPGGAPVLPRDLADLDVAVAAGAPAVAECGAVWVAPGDVLARAALFLAEHVVLVVPRSALVDSLHEAYASSAVRRARYGCFVAGPSKTADIEQALVIGAHGPRSLHVVLHGAEG